MKLKPGDKALDISLPAIDGSIFNSGSVHGKRYMISFFRFAACPFCNLRVHQLVSRFSEFGEDFPIVAIFDSPLDNLQKHAKKHQAPFPILADEENTYYKKYSIEHSVYGMFKGMIVRMPSLLYSMFVKGNIPFPIKGSLITMPADFLVDENGTIQVAWYGKDEGDHLPIDDIKVFSRA